MHWNIDPIIVDLGPIELRYYSILFGIGLFSVFFIVSKLMQQQGLKKNYADKLFIYVVISLIIGAHLAHLIFYEPSSLMTISS